MHRRQLLKYTGALALPAVMAGRVWAAPQTRTRLLVVFLRGGYDAANLVIPYGSDFYYQQRPTIAIAKPDPANPNAALPLDADWGLHPAMKESLYPLWQKKQLAFVPFAGTDDMTRSHFETQDTIEMGQPLTGARDYGSGFMNRLATQLTGVKPIAFTDQLPITFRGHLTVANMSVNLSGKPAVDDRQVKLIENMYQGQSLAPSISEGFQVRDEVYRSISAEMIAANRGAVSPKGFELSARRIARLMKTDFNLGFVDVGGWDTHVNEGGVTGYLPDRLSELARGLAGYADEIGPDGWDNTVVVVVSEFGRTFHENGDKGTDHGHGSTYWVMGGKVNGGRMIGEQKPVIAANLVQNRDYPVLNEYRSTLAGLFQRMYGLSPERVAAVFPGAEAKDLKLV